MNVTIVGPTSSGKTVYLASLLRASHAYAARGETDNVSIFPESDDALRLDEMAADVIMGNRIRATRGLREYSMIASLPGGMFGAGGVDVNIKMYDLPGGDCMPRYGVRIPYRILRTIGESDALIVAVSASRDKRPSNMKTRLSYLLEQSEDYRDAKKDGDYLYDRICVVMTMSDILVEDKGNRALNELERMDAKETIIRACGWEFTKYISDIVPTGADWYSLVSAYGFDPYTGGIAATSVDSEWQIDVCDNYGIREDWWPYRVYEPIEWIARGWCTQDAYAI